MYKIFVECVFGCHFESDLFQYIYDMIDVLNILVFGWGEACFEWMGKIDMKFNKNFMFLWNY